MTPQEAKDQHGATHYITMKDGVTPQMYYKQERVIWNDNTSNMCWVYLSYCNLWQGSNIRIGSEDEQRLVPIDYTPDPRIKPYLDKLEAEGPGIPYVSNSHGVLWDIGREHGHQVVKELLDAHFKRYRINGGSNASKES